MVLDNGRFHHAKRLIIPNNIVLIFLPPYSPELNPAEHIWLKLKREFSNMNFQTIDDLKYWLFGLYNSIDKTTIKSTTNYEYVKLCNIWAEMNL